MAKATLIRILSEKRFVILTIWEVITRLGVLGDQDRSLSWVALLKERVSKVGEGANVRSTLAAALVLGYFSASTVAHLDNQRAGVLRLLQ